jgi:Glycosyl transferase family 11
LRTDQDKQIIEMMKQLESVSIFIRRTDYVGSDFDGMCSDEYYDQAIALMKQKLDNTVFFIFSDDIEWCKQHFNAHRGQAFDYFIDWNTEDLPALKNIFLMSHCKHQIIANSSFARRGARLNSNFDKTIIAPKRRHQKLDRKDFVPENWIKL